MRKTVLDLGSTSVRYTGREAVYCTDPGSQPGNCNPNLNDGEILDSQQYPVVWQNGEYVY